MNRELDELDLKILRLLQNDARISLKSIAERVFVSTPTVAARIEEMTERGIIKGYYTEIDNSVFENVIKAYIDMEVSPSIKEKLYEYLRAAPQVNEPPHFDSWNDNFLTQQKRGISRMRYPSVIFCFTSARRRS